MKLRIPLILSVFCASCFAWSQGLFVQPASHEVSVKAGVTYELPLILRNNQSDIPNTVEISALYLQQSLGGFEAIEVEKITPEVLRSFPSCLPWMRLPNQTRLTLQPLDQQNLSIRMSVPASARGFYCAALIVASQKPQPETKLKVVLRFVIPILVHVEAGVSKKGGTVQDASAAFTPSAQTHPAGTVVACMVKNTGDALARFSGRGDVFQVRNGRKRRVISATFEERRIIPNATVALNFLSLNRLPSGPYRFEGVISMEGQRLPDFQKEIVVQGDPSVTAAEANVEISLSPDPLEFNATPGATRGLPFKVLNSSSDPIVVEGTVTTPTTLMGATGPFGAGEDFSIAGWCTQPVANAVVGGGQERTLRILTSVPEGLLSKPFYYGELHLVAKTREGAVVGSGTLLLIGKNKTVLPVLRFAASGDIQISQVKDHTYGFTCQFSNSGNAIVEPQVEARVVDSARIATILILQASGIPKRILPTQRVRPSGQIDVNQLKDGEYVLEVVMKTGTIRESKTAGIKVSTVRGEKRLSLVALNNPVTKPAKH